MLTCLGGTGSISLFDHLLSAANVDGSGSRTHASVRAYADIFSPSDTISSSRTSSSSTEREVVDSEEGEKRRSGQRDPAIEGRLIAGRVYILNAMNQAFFKVLSCGG